ncbi:dihydrodipicolinate synthase family protein [Streptomyces sp. NPDC058683]|uniref:dihydrodipicolinate synthase family protein n=1 Tax=Streptomyces sp. NPDC058683 TaxID=3346597 RepID=UPI003659FB0B
MASYTREEARDWARAHLKGVINVIIPSFTTDLEGINEAAVRNDVRKQFEYGFDGALLVSEVVLSLDEYRRFCEVAADEAKGGQTFVHHSAWSTLEQARKALRVAEDTGAELVLLTYPPGFYPTSEEDVYTYTKAICDSTRLAVMLFPVPTWGFGSRIHPSEIPVGLIRRLIDDCPNIVAIKAEGGAPTAMGLIECYRHFGEEIVISCPIEAELIPLAQVMPIELSATSDHEYYGPMMPRIMKHLQAGEFDAATDLFWQLQPARKAKMGTASAHGLGLINRTMWKYQAWLQGYSGGPLRHPTMRIHDAQMNALRRGLVAAGLEPTKDLDSEFFVGRYPS